ncbi:MAG: class I SAM-dependent methyltransferase [Bacteroidetes bacterium]|nr:class I SAM-dependent methyltransferase [Bacteroidota bacterium]
MIRNKLLLFARKTGLISYLERIAPAISFIRHLPNNLNQDVPKVPVTLLFESFGKVDFTRFDESGKLAALNLAALVNRHVSPTSILDIGCGLGRVSTKLAGLYPGATITGCDVIEEMISSNQKRHPGMTWIPVKVNQPIQVPDASIDLAFALSVITHLSEESITILFSDVNRILNKDGVFLFTTIGQFYADLKLVDHELADFNSGKPVYRGNVPNTSRLFTSYHPDSYMKKLLDPLFILVEEQEGASLQLAGSQKIWLVKKK